MKVNEGVWEVLTHPYQYGPENPDPERSLCGLSGHSDGDTNQIRSMVEKQNVEADRSDKALEAISSRSHRPHVTDMCKHFHPGLRVDRGTETEKLAKESADLREDNSQLYNLVSSAKQGWRDWATRKRRVKLDTVTLTHNGALQAIEDSRQQWPQDEAWSDVLTKTKNDLLECKDVASLCQEGNTFKLMDLASDQLTEAAENFLDKKYMTDEVQDLQSSFRNIKQPVTVFAAGHKAVAKNDAIVVLGEDERLHQLKDTVAYSQLDNDSKNVTKGLDTLASQATSEANCPAKPDILLMSFDDDLSEGRPSIQSMEQESREVERTALTRRVERVHSLVELLDTMRGELRKEAQATEVYEREYHGAFGSEAGVDLDDEASEYNTSGGESPGEPSAQSASGSDYSP